MSDLAKTVNIIDAFLKEYPLAKLEIIPTSELFNHSFVFFREFTRLNGLSRDGLSSLLCREIYQRDNIESLKKKGIAIIQTE